MSVFKNTTNSNTVVVFLDNEVLLETKVLFDAEQYCRENKIPFGYIWVVDPGGELGVSTCSE